MSTPFENLSSLIIGTVESVSPSEIKVQLEMDAPQTMALNTGVPTAFPRINSYVIIPNETGAVVGLIVWLGIERSNYSKNAHKKDKSLIDLPFPQRKMTVSPVGTLVSENSADGKNVYKLERGVFVFPSVGDPVLLPTVEKLLSIVESHGKDRRVEIGVSPLASKAVIAVDPDKLFGRHLAVLGNTGSGKSCSVAGLIRWSIEAASKERAKAGREGRPNARFIVLDPNGEYHQVFSDIGSRIYKVPPVDDEAHTLSVPAWMWNSQEWSAFANAAPGAQRPLLLQGLRDMRAGEVIQEPVVLRISRVFRSYKASIDQMIAQGVSAYTGFPNNRNCGNHLRNIATDAERYVEEAEEVPLKDSLEALNQTTNSICDDRHWSTANSEGYNNFSETDIVNVQEALNLIIENLPEETHALPPSEDAPIAFPVEHLADHLEQIAANANIGQAAQFIATLSMRIRMMLADRRLGPIVCPEQQPTFVDWLNGYIGTEGAATGEIAVLDLSLVPTDVLHIVIAVIARIIFEALQRYRKLNGYELATVLVLEEAHTFIGRGFGENNDAIPRPIQMCRQTFERIAREGRKFGLGLLLSSQRPSELSATVLSQCNTFLLHRIVNDRDQDLVNRLVPDNLVGLLKELPNLPTRQAILLGWATPIPVLLEMKKLSQDQCPCSFDPDFWDVWTGKEERPINWQAIKDDWTS